MHETLEQIILPYLGDVLSFMLTWKNLTSPSRLAVAKAVPSGEKAASIIGCNKNIHKKIINSQHDMSYRSIHM